MSMLARLATTGGAAPLYVDDVFSTYLYTGNGSTQTINNGIDLAGKGGLVWIKPRNVVSNHFLADTVRGGGNVLFTNTTGANNAITNISSFNSNGFTLNTVNDSNGSGNNLVSWTFRRAPKFFDVVTYTGNGASSRDISHALGANVGFAIIKRTSSAANWAVLARAATQFYVSDPGGSSSGLNLTGALNATGDFSYATSTVFKVGSAWWGIGANNETLNNNTESYVAYLFAHDTSTDGLIQCGSFTTDGSGNATVNLGWEPQYVMVKAASAAGIWFINDVMRGYDTSASDKQLYANSSSAEVTAQNGQPNATGFSGGFSDVNVTYIYLAIRRPNKPPTSGTQVYNASTSANVDIDVGFPVDMAILNFRSGDATNAHAVVSRLTGQKWITTQSTAAEQTAANTFIFDKQNIFRNDQFGGSRIEHFFRRAPGFLDVVCYTGTGATATVTHNLGAVPQLIIVKRRNSTGLWPTYTAFSEALSLNNSNNAGFDFPAGSFGNGTTNVAPTASVFTVSSAGALNASGGTYVAYLFATLPGISKVGSYTGNGGTVNTNGTSQTINCGFTGGARFVLIKRTDSTGDWYVFDTARGIVAASDPYLLLNSTAAEVTTVDAVDTNNSGFIVNQTSGTNLNVTNATYIYLAIA